MASLVVPVRLLLNAECRGHHTPNTRRTAAELCNGVTDSMRGLDEVQNDPTLLSIASIMYPSNAYVNDVLGFQVRDQSLVCCTKEAAGIQTNISKQTSQGM